MTNSVALAGITLTPLRQIVDERGAVLHMLRADAPEFLGFGECYFSVVNPGALKAWKRHKRQTQNVAVPHGRVRFVLWDDRADSVTRGELQVVELGRPDAYARLCIPPMVWYGFTGIGDGPALIANCADLPHESGESEAVGTEALPSHGALDLLRAAAHRS